MGLARCGSLIKAISLRDGCYIPGLAGTDPISGRTGLRTDVITVERSWAMDPKAAVAGFLYL